MWTNPSETTFLCAPTDPGADYRVRIWTTTGELPFAGHPTIGSAHAWLEAGRVPRGDVVVQECGAGLVDVRRSPRLGFAAPPLRRSGPVDADLRARVLTGLAIDDAVIWKRERGAESCARATSPQRGTASVATSWSP